jgi:GTP1/Obg family GTP-binding protein
MQSKMTLLLDEELIKKAEAAALERGKSVSQMVAEFFESLGKNAPYDKELPPLTSSLLGILKGVEVDVDDYKKHLEEKFS